MEVVRCPETFYPTWCNNAEYCHKQIRVHPRQGHEGPEGGGSIDIALLLI